jgi:molybdopterin/thiamine biosynthesis adenylyltransferase
MCPDVATFTVTETRRLFLAASTTARCAVDRPTFLTWPHIEQVGLLCLASNTLEVDPENPVGVVTVLLDTAFKAVESLTAGALDADFRDEFATYWGYSSEKSGKELISLVKPEPPTRTIKLCRGDAFDMLAETDAEIRRWLENRFGKVPVKLKIEPAAFIWIGEPPVPRDYPASGSSLVTLATATSPQASSLLAELANDNPNNIVTVLGVETANGPAVAGVVAPRPAPIKHGPRDPLTKGFRPGTVPAPILTSRYFGASKVVRRPIERADATWIHGRGRDPRAARLQHERVVAIGCGSIGAPVAIALAQAGVGHLTLIDYDILKWANIGRHPLGATYVGQYKSKALAQKLRADFPHASFDHLEVDADTTVRLHTEIIEGADLILAATGSWAADGRLDAWHTAGGRTVPVIYAWTEAHACAGHAAVLCGSQACLRCGFDNTGLPNFRITDWPNGATTHQEPACGAIYQPYGPIELGFINSLVGEMALDVLLQSEVTPAHRIWVGQQQRLVELGGTWSPQWRNDPSFREEGGLVVSRAWSHRACAHGSESQVA